VPIGNAVKPLAVLSEAVSSLVVPLDYRSVRGMPAQGKHVHRRGVLVVPAAAIAPADPTEGIITSYTVPNGWLFLLTHILLQYMGATAAADFEGLETELFYTLRVDGRQFPDDFGTINTSLGGLSQGPYPISGGIQFSGGNLVELVVNVPSGSMIATGGTNRVFGHLIGWARPGGRTAIGANASEG
jgi:hypothetical protein